ncbi:HAMP domain-containing protein [Rhizobiales bacterium RZME27]|uniref:HAMP domain-containing protein n=1 Tax=Endobacterium cereale TaxID=2663029 RepID=A0A6A8A308_9HYPH|nr:HAMP domain-containing methyl-accepting chemotaxis protein [Endobacterium cereale]MEB2844575.1 methyl-accepting chemotaxis protein [Endobacterium cereale]MQY45109.1 HAMP domain-containing protein [Endobacterium cereale]
MKLSVRNILVTVFAVLSLTVMGLMGQQLLRQIDAQRTSSQLAGLASLDKALFDALLGMRGERGAINSAVKLEPADMASTRKNIDDGRRDLDAAFKDAKSVIDTVEPASLKTSLGPVLDNYAKWLDLRPKMDAALAQPVKDRDAGVGKSALTLADQMLVDLEKASYQVEAVINARGPAMIMFTQLRSLAWTSRTQLGTANSSIVGAIISKQPLSAEKLAEVAVQDARVFLAWDVISQIVASDTTPVAIRELHKVAQNTYFSGAYAEQKAAALKQFQAGQPFAMNVDDWRKPAGPAQASLADIASASLKEMTAITAANNAASLQSIIVYGIATLLALALSIVGFSTIIFRIANPITALTGAMRKLAAGDLSVAITGAARKDEIGDMARAVEIFREASVHNRELEAEAIRSRELAEAERIAFQKRAESEAETRLTQATSGLATGLRRLAAGDLLCEIDEVFSEQFEALRHDFNSSVRHLREALEGVAKSALTVRSGSGEISSASDQLAKRTEQQAASLEETAAALEEVTTNVKQTSERAAEAREMVRHASTRAGTSSSVVANAIDAMGKIEAASAQIGQIIGVINDIAFQTNLLALNAGVEAARAGEAGKGFAVVAQEVRELAQRSANAAKEIKTLVGNSEAAVTQGVTLVNDTGNGLKEIADLVASINQHMDAIAVGAKEQASGLTEINTSVNHMDQVTQQNAAMVEEMNAAGAGLADESARLSSLLSRFEMQHAAPAGQYGRRAA